MALHLCDSRNAERLYYRIKNLYKVKVFLTNSVVSNNAEINGIPLINFYDYVSQNNNITEKIIFVTTRPEQCKNEFIALKNKNLSMPDDFITSELFLSDHINIEKVTEFYGDENKIVDFIIKMSTKWGRKICILNGNCQIMAIKEYLLHCPQFVEKYYIVDIPLIYNINDKNANIFEMRKLFSCCDLLISQSISNQNHFCDKASTEHVFSMVKDDCKKVVISKASFTGYHIQYTNDIGRLNKVVNKPVITYGDKNLNYMIDEGYELSTIKKLLQGNIIYTKKQIDTHIQAAIQKSIDMEHDCDIKIMDYVLGLYKHEILYYSFNHPKTKVIKYLVEKLLQYIGIGNYVFEGQNIIEQYSIMNNQQQPIYPCVYNYLGLPYDKNQIIYTEKNNMANYAAMTFDQYIEFYYNLYKKKKSNEKISISIYGCCASREMFNYSDKFDVQFYVMRNPIVTMFSPSLFVECREKDPNISPFLNRMLYYDFYKKAWKEFLEHKSDYCLIDFGDVRYDYYEFLHNGARISKNEQSQNFIKKICAEMGGTYDLKYKIINIKDITDEEINFLMEKFCRDLLKVYRPNHIVLNKIKLATKFVTVNKFDSVVNEFSSDDWTLDREAIIKRFENVFLKLVPGCKVLEFPPKELMISSENHYLGDKHPFHWIPEIYDAKIRYFNELINDNNQNVFNSIENDLKLIENIKYYNDGARNDGKE